MTSKRVEWVDLLKGFAIISVVFLHACGGTDKFTLILKWITSFHMFLFFFLSGLFFKGCEGRFKDFLLGKAQVLMVPYFFYGILIGMPVEIIRCKIQGHPIDIRDLIIDAVTFNSGYSPTWFLCSLFTIYLIEYGIFKYVKNASIRVIVHIIIFITAYFAPFYINSFMRLKTTLFCLFFFFLGKILKQKVEEFLSNFKYKFCVMLMMLTMGTIFALVNETVSASKAEFGNLVLCFFAAIWIIFGMIVLSYFFCQVKNKFFRGLIQQVIFFGKNSIIILCTHSFVLLSARVFAKMLNIGVHDLPIVLTTIYVLLVSYFVICVVKKRLKFTIGQK